MLQETWPPMNEQPSGARKRQKGLHRHGRRWRRWAARAFAGLTWRWFAIFCAVVLVFALSRPNVSQALLTHESLVSVLRAVARAYLLSWLKFTPVLLAVVATANLVRGPNWKRMTWIAIALTAGTIAGTVLSWSLAPLFFENTRIREILAKDPPMARMFRYLGLATVDLVLCAMAVGFGYYVKRSAAAAADLRSEEAQREEVERENVEARLSLMQAQIEPHFLFNSLASIRRLYETDPTRGRSMLQHLSRYLAASLPALRESHSTLGRELALAVAYLNVQKIRMGARLAVRVDVPEQLHPVPVPPMMLPTLVENAIVHGVGPVPKGGTVEISARMTDDKLLVQVADTGRGLTDTWGAGVGLANVRARLQSEFGPAAQFRLDARGGGGAVASIELPVRTTTALAA
jgi:sensor histidine kinase YesM